MYTLGSKIIGYLEKTDRLMNGEKVFPVTCEIDTSNYCQNNCNWCIYSDYIKSNRMHLDFDLFCNIVLQLKVFGCKSITFTGGGEPLMNPNIVKMIEHAHSLDFELGLITNGILLDSIAHQIPLFKFIRVSLDATTAETYEKDKGTGFFDVVCGNVRAISSVKSVDVGISMVYNPDNWTEAKAFPEFGKSLGATYSQVKPLVDGNIEKASDEISKIGDAFVTKRYSVNGFAPCKIAGLIGQVAADGKYYYCCIHRGKPGYEIGDFRKDLLVDLIGKRSDFVPDLDECFSCRYMNYAKEYLKLTDDKFNVLRHINFL